MILTYGITVLITGVWILKMIQEKTFIFKRTPLDIPLLLFLGANILSTIFSIDPHTSIWGYYSRSNGGLLSILSYLLLYWAFVSNLTSTKIATLLKFALISGAIISIWGIFEHFGVSLSCIVLRGDFNASCWVQDVQARVFASLGQPNWLAGYLVMLIFPALYFYLSAVTRRIHVMYYILLLTFYLAFTFTYSRGPTLGLIGGLITFILIYAIPNIKRASPRKFWVGWTWFIFPPWYIPMKKEHLKHPLFLVLISFLLVNILFGSALTNFRLVAKFASPPRPTIVPPTSSVTQLETGGTESGQIRLIVWKGSLDIFKHYPILGSGVETFAQIYYQFRPVEHNHTSEWDYLYNKAHNEYLNYLATTGFVGFGTYIFLIGSFIYWATKKILNPKSSIINLLMASLLASYISYLIYNFFLFSVVILAIFFYLFPAIAFVATESVKSFKLPSSFQFLVSSFQFIYRRNLYTKIAKGIVIFLTLYLLYSIFKIWYADTLFNLGQRASELGNPGRAYNQLTAAVELNKSEPFYQSELAYSAASAALAINGTDATLSAELKNQAIFITEKVLREHPKNVSYYRTAVRTYFELSSLDKKYIQTTLEVLNKAIALAPTDPKLYYNKALILHALNRKDEEVKVLQEALNLKPDYLELLDQLKEATASAKP